MWTKLHSKERPINAYCIKEIECTHANVLEEGHLLNYAYACMHACS